MKLKMSQKIKLLNMLKRLFSDEGILKEIIIGACMLAVFAVVDVFLHKQKFDIRQSLELDVAVTVSITMIIASLLKVFAKGIEIWLEDSSKLTVDYDRLLKLYGSEKDNAYVIYKNNSDKKAGDRGAAATSCSCRNEESSGRHKEYCFPVVWLFKNFHGANFVIYDSGHMYTVPDIVTQNYVKLFEFHSYSNVYNNLNIRLIECAADSGQSKIELHTERTTYFNSLVTNRAMDAPLYNRLTLRNIFQVGRALVPLKSSAFSNHLGFNGFVETSDGKIVFIVRGRNMSVAKYSLGTSVGASLKTKYALEAGIFTPSGLEKGIQGELKDELGLEPETYSYSNGKNIIAGYRDLVEGGKPQLLFYVKCSYDEQAFRRNFFKARKGTKKKKLAASIEEQMKRDGKKLVFIPVDKLDRMFIAPDGIAFGGKHYSMVPSASASIVMLLEYLRDRTEKAHVSDY